MTAKILGPIGMAAFEGRGINPETAVRFGIFTASRKGDEIVPDVNGSVVVFPFFENGQTVNEKFRAPGKKFWQRKNGRRTFWNADVLDDPALENGSQALIITEGELDALTAIDCGFPFSVSVPDGAPPIKQTDDLKENIDDDMKGKFEFLWNNRDRLRRIKRFIITVDNDPPGQRLAAELVRRLLASRCFFVTYPDGCKDLNDVRMQHGPEAVASVLNSCKPYPVKGLYRLSDYPDLPALETFRTGWQILDQHFKLWKGELIMVTGIPGHGKSAFVHALLVNLAQSFGWRAAMFAAEEPTVPQLRDKLRRLYLGETLLDLDRKRIADADAFIESRFSFIDADPRERETASDEVDFDIDWILDRAVDAVLRDGIQILLIDPWNEVEHAKRKDELMTDYHSRAIRLVKRFARLYGVICIIVAHPTKEVGREGKRRMPTPYDTDGSAHFYNKSDHFLIIYRENEFTNQTTINVAKSKFEESGKPGIVHLAFNEFSGRYSPLQELDDADNPIPETHH